MAACVSNNLENGRVSVRLGVKETQAKRLERRESRNSLRKLPALTCLAVGAAAICFGASSSSIPNPPVAPTPEQATFFESKIRPVFATNCLPCHSKSSHMSGLALDSRNGFLKGGDSGPLVVSGDAEKSLLVQVVRQSGPVKMPQGGKLKPAQIADIEAWVRMGAPWPEDGASKLDKTDVLWSLQPVTKPRPPHTRLANWVANPIDSFVLNQLEAKGLKPSPAADRRTLIRRVTYDLTGLPPSPSEIDAFLADKASNAYEKVVDRLLASPRYGERWARHWLDVARYADTKGYMATGDRNYPNAYTYRDWVIDAMNQDLPYDQFIEQQLAADLLPRVKSGEDVRPLAALGFLTVGRRFLDQTPDIIDDRIDVTMRGFEGFTVACARCHDHKFDPIPTQDYYSLYSVFASSQENDLPISDRSIRDPWIKHNGQVSSSTQALHEVVVKEVQRLREAVLAPGSAAQIPADVKATLQSVRVEDLPEGQNLAVISKAFQPEAKAHLQQLQDQLAALAKDAPPSPEFAMAMQDRPDAADGVVFRRGNPNSRGPVAPRRFLAALSKPGEERPHWIHGSGRLDLAEAIASKDNPLTARVFVNRMWLHDFGTGIVRTPSDFGHQGEKPTNPELLDYLAATFVENGWSMKKLNRLIVTSATYRQSSNVSPAMLNADPENRLYGRMNRKRLDLEEMRDSVLFTAGKLDVSQVGGRSVDLWSAPFTPRRAIYGFIERQNLPGIFRVFDFATPDATSPKRFMTTVPQQALFFMNSQFAIDAAKAAVERPDIATCADEGRRIRLLYRDILDRLPDPSEAGLGLHFLGSNPLAPVEAPTSAWQYGYGGFDAASQRVEGFKPFSVFKDQSYRPATQFPDAKLGYLTLSAQGGHPGRDGEHAAIRLWKAPRSMTVSIAGTLQHGQAQGDGVRGRIVSSRSGLLGEWKVHNGLQEANVQTLKVVKGETIAFILDPMADDSFDSFSWAPRISEEKGDRVWDSAKDFSAPPAAPLTRLVLYAQALMMTNEFMFVD
jgi:mono/diheme cytochrome c family protein